MIDHTRQCLTAETAPCIFSERFKARAIDAIIVATVAPHCWFQAVQMSLSESIGFHFQSFLCFPTVYFIKEGCICRVPSQTVTFEEAKFMLVACSAFINYVRGVTKS